MMQGYHQLTTCEYMYTHKHVLYSLLLLLLNTPGASRLTGHPDHTAGQLDSQGIPGHLNLWDISTLEASQKIPQENLDHTTGHLDSRGIS